MNLHPRMVSLNTALALLIVTSSGASAATITRWDFNGTTKQGIPAGDPASEGIGTFSTFGGLTFLGTLNTIANGSPGDPRTAAEISAGTLNQSQVLNTQNVSLTQAGPTASGSRGVQFTTSTAGYNNLSISWHLSAGSRSTRYYQIYATSDGTNYNPVPTGIGSTASVLGAGTQLSTSANVDNNGLVTVVAGQMPGPLTPVGTDGLSFIYDFTYTFPAGSAFENNPNFGVRIAPVIDSSAGDYVSSLYGTTVSDATTGYARTSGTSGQVRYDYVTVSGVPEPTGLCLAGCGIAIVGAIKGRRRDA